MVAAEKRLLARALLDPDNQQFVLLSERYFTTYTTLLLCVGIVKELSNPSSFCSCVPLHTFDYVYNYLMFTNVSYIEWYASGYFLCSMPTKEN